MLSDLEDRQETSVIWALISDGSQAYIFRYCEDKIISTLRASKRRPAHSGHRNYPLSFISHLPHDMCTGSQDDQYSQFSIKNGSQTQVYRFLKQPRLAKSERVAQFLQNIAAKLHKASEENAFDYLVIVAPRQAMNALESSLSNQVRQRILPNMPAGYVYDKKGCLFSYTQEPPCNDEPKTVQVRQLGVDKLVANAFANHGSSEVWH